jgi:hypothetical protein
MSGGWNMGVEENTYAEAFLCLQKIAAMAICELWV